MSDLAELFARDPLSLTREDIDHMVQHYREARAKFLLGEKMAGKTKPAKTEKKPINLNLEDLDI